MGLSLHFHGHKSILILMHVFVNMYHVLEPCHQHGKLSSRYTFRSTIVWFNESLKCTDLLAGILA